MKEENTIGWQEDIQNLTISEIRKIAITSLSNDTDYVNISKSFSKEYLKLNKNPNKKDLLDFKVVTLKVMLQVFSDLKNKTYQDDQQDKRNKINKEELENFVNQENKYLTLKYKVSDFVTNRENKRLSEGLAYLVDYKKQFYTIDTPSGKKLKTYGGFLSQFFIDENSGEFFVLVNTYWIKQIVDLSDSFSYVFLDHFEKLKDIKKFLFSVVVSEMKMEQPLTFNVDTLLDNYNLNYKFPSQLIRGFLEPIKIVMDVPIQGIDKNQHSFNYSLSEDKKKITITKYYLKPNEKDIPVTVFSKQDYFYKMSYFKKRHQLSNEDMKFLSDRLSPIKQGDIYLERELYKDFINAYALFVADCRQQKIKPTTITSENFIDCIKQFLKDESKLFFDYNK